MEYLAGDVVVIGSGCAGLVAAIKAKLAGAEVLVLSKAVSGGANNTTVSGGGFFTSCAGLTKEDHFRLTLETGQQFNDCRLVEVLVENAEKSVLNLQQYGVDIRPRDRGYCTPGQIHVEGANISRPLMQHARKIGVKFLGQFMAFDLINNEDSRIMGVFGCDYKSGKLLIVGAKALILAAGGGGNLYARSDNPYPITADGYAIAGRADLPLVDMEFVQFYPLSIARPGVAAAFIHPAAAEVGRLINRRGEDVVAKYEIEVRPLAIRARDRLSQAIVRENTLSGGNSDVLLDLTGFSEQEWQERARAFPPGQVRQLRQALEKKYNASQEPLPVLPTCHFIMGGVTINEQTSTPIAGLFAAGEIVGGLHGANRLGGNALTEAVVFGEIAGNEAAKYAAVIGMALDQRHLLDETEKKLQQLREVFLGQTPPDEIRREMRRVMWEQVGVIRNGPDLEMAVILLAELERELAIPNWQNPRELIRPLETLNQLQVGRMIALAALRRTESRGSHFREDFPQTDSRLLHHFGG